jgi:hypothetical protein
MPLRLFHGFTTNAYVTYGKLKDCFFKIKIKIGKPAMVVRYTDPL